MTAIDPTIFGTGNAAIDSYYASSPAGGAAFGPAVKVTTVSSDPAASAQNNLQRQFWGDYNTLVSKDGSAWFICSSSIRERSSNEKSVRPIGRVGRKPPKDGEVPAPPVDCLSQFGNTDVFVGVITA